MLPNVIQRILPHDILPSLFCFSLFELVPEAKILFGFPVDLDTTKLEVLRGKRFLQHAAFLISMIDKTVNMLGVDNKQLTKTLTKLGKMHVTYGVKPDYFPMMTKSIVFMLKQLLGESWQYSDEASWNSVLGSLIAGMVKGQRKLDKGLAAANKSTVITNWRSLMQVKNYEERSGVIIFKRYVLSIHPPVNHWMAKCSHPTRAHSLTHPYTLATSRPSLFAHSLFKDLPQAMPLFGFPHDVDFGSIAESRRFLTHAVFLVEMIHKALNMLGENDQELEQTMMALGKKHIGYGVKPQYFPVMVEAIIAMLHEMLGAKFTPEDQDAWEEVLSVLISDMSRAQRLVRMQEAASAHGKN